MASQESKPQPIARNFFVAAIAVLDSYVDRDPAALGRLHVALCNTGLHAVMWHRCCHMLWNLKLRTIARMLSNIGRFLFGPEIHPEAQIGERLFIDHGSAIVIGATAKIGNDVSIYQGATLGGLTQQERTKRHPNLGNNVIVGAGAKLLGPIQIGNRARIGSNAVVLTNVEADSTMVGIPARKVSTRVGDLKFVAYGCGKELEEKCHEFWAQDLAALSARVAELEKTPRRHSKSAATQPSAPTQRPTKPRKK